MYSCQVINENLPSEEPDAERTRLSKRAVVDRALKLADADGLDTLTIRKLAQDLGVTPMALYWHFRSKDDLLEGMAEQVWSEIDVTRRPVGPVVGPAPGRAGVPAPGAACPSGRAPAGARAREAERGGAARHRGRPGDPAAAPASIHSTPARSPAARCGPGSRWS